MHWLGVLLIVAFLSSCSSVSNMPNDEVYYTKKAKNPSEYNWEDFQKNAETYSKGNVNVDNKGSQKEGEVSGGDIATTVDANDTDGDYQYIDEYYDGGEDYSSRIKHFSDDNTSNGFGYYDGYYGGGGGYGYGSSMSNWSMGIGIGFGYGYPGYSMGYGYGWPSYGYGGSYWAGYNAGYMNGYWNGYYGYPYYGCGYCGYGGYGGYYGGGYYGGYYGGNPDYIGTPSVVYGPRGGTTGGTTIPHSRGEGPSGRPGDNTGKSGSAGSSRGTVVAAPVTTANTNSTGRSIETGDKTTERLAKPASGSVATTAPKSEYYRTRAVTENIARDKMSKPQTRQQSAQQTVPQKRYEKPVTKQRAGLPEPKYEKPKSYQSLPSRKPQSSQEYVRPTNRMTRTTTKNYSPYSRTRPVTTSTSTRSTISNGSPARSYTPTRSSGTRSYSSPSIRSTGSRSYSTPTRSTGGGGSFSRSSSSGVSRSSGVRSSGSTSRGGGGIKR